MTWNERQRQIIKEMQGLKPQPMTELELDQFLLAAEVQDLDPITGQIYATRRRGRLVVGASIDGLRASAERTGKYRGQVGPWWCGEDGQWLDVWLADGSPSAAKVGILRADFLEPLYAVARFRSYAQTDDRGNVRDNWASMPDVMLAKVAESLALRKAFPQVLGRLYSPEELGEYEPGSSEPGSSEPGSSEAEPKAEQPEVKTEQPPAPKAEQPRAKTEQPRARAAARPATPEIVKRSIEKRVQESLSDGQHSDGKADTNTRNTVVMRIRELFPNAKGREVDEKRHQLLGYLFDQPSSKVLTDAQARTFLQWASGHTGSGWGALPDAIVEAERIIEAVTGMAQQKLPEKPPDDDSPHWTQVSGEVTAFWTYVYEDLGLTREEALTALEGDRLEDYPQSRGQAITDITHWMAQQIAGEPDEDPGKEAEGTEEEPS